MSYEKATNVIKKLFLGGGSGFSCFYSLVRDHLPHGLISNLPVFTTLLREYVKYLHV